MSWTVMQSFSFIPLMSSEKKTFDFFFQKFSLSVAMQTIKISDLDKIQMVGKGLLQKHFCDFFFQNICSNTVINANFHFSYYKSMETLSCQSNESTWATTIKDIFYVEANVMNKYAKFQLHPPYGFWGEDFWIFFSKIYPLCCHSNQSSSATLTKFIWIVEDYSRNISVKKI